MPTAAIRLTEEESRLIKSYAKAKRRSVSEVIRLAVLDQIEDEYDLGLFKQAKAEFDNDPATISHSEMMRKYFNND